MSRRVGNDNSLQLSHFTVDTSIRRGHPRWFRATVEGGRIQRLEEQYLP